MKMFKKTTASSPKEDATNKEVDVVAKADVTNKETDVSAKKVDVTGFQGWKDKMKGLTGNFRQKAEQAGVPPERVKDFKYWLRENHYE